MPDEPNHFFRAFQISEGKFIAELDDRRVGGRLPVELWQFKSSFDGVISGGKAQNALRTGASNSIVSGERSFMDFNNTALYSPVCYAPQAISIFILRLFDLPLICIFYGARVFTLVCWILALFQSIRWMPFCRWLLAAIALLPMSLFVNSSLSADVMTNAVSFMLFAKVLQLRFSVRTLISRHDVAVLFFLLLILSQLKPVYIVLALMCALIKPLQFGSRVRAVAAYCMIAAVTIGPFLCWNYVVERLYLGYDDYNSAYIHRAALLPGLDAGKQMELLRSGMVNPVDVITDSAVRIPYYHIPGYVATFGWGDVYSPTWLQYLLYFILILVAATEIRAAGFNWRVRLWLIFIFLLTLSAVLIAQFIIWTPVGKERVDFIQMRYLIPVFPLLLFSAGGFLKIASERHLLFLVTFFTAAGSLCLRLLWERYF